MKSNDLFQKYCLFKFNIANVTFFYWIMVYWKLIVSKNDLVGFFKKKQTRVILIYSVTENFNILCWHNQTHTFSTVKVN